MDETQDLSAHGKPAAQPEESQSVQRPQEPTRMVAAGAHSIAFASMLLLGFCFGFVRAVGLPYDPDRLIINEVDLTKHRVLLIMTNLGGMFVALSLLVGGVGVLRKARSARDWLLIYGFGGVIAGIIGLTVWGTMMRPVERLDGHGEVIVGGRSMSATSPALESEIYWHRVQAILTSVPGTRTMIRVLPATSFCVLVGSVVTIVWFLRRRTRTAMASWR